MDLIEQKANELGYSVGKDSYATIPKLFGDIRIYQTILAEPDRIYVHPEAMLKILNNTTDLNETIDILLNAPF